MALLVRKLPVDERAVDKGFHGLHLPMQSKYSTLVCVLSKCSSVFDKRWTLQEKTCDIQKPFALPSASGGLVLLGYKESLHQLFQAKNIHYISIKGLFCDQSKWKDQLAPVFLARAENLSLVISGQNVLTTSVDTTSLYPAITLEISIT